MIKEQKICEYCGKVFTYDHKKREKVMCGNCREKLKIVKKFIKTTEPCRVALEKKKARAMFDERY